MHRGGLFQEANLCVSYVKRVTIKPSDIQLARRILRNQLSIQTVVKAEPLPVVQPEPLLSLLSPKPAFGQEK